MTPTTSPATEVQRPKTTHEINVRTAPERDHRMRAASVCDSAGDGCSEDPDRAYHAEQPRYLGPEPEARLLQVQTPISSRRK